MYHLKQFLLIQLFVHAYGLDAGDNSCDFTMPAGLFDSNFTCSSTI